MLMDKQSASGTRCAACLFHNRQGVYLPSVECRMSALIGGESFEIASMRRDGS